MEIPSVGMVNMDHLSIILLLLLLNFLLLMRERYAFTVWVKLCAEYCDPSSQSIAVWIGHNLRRASDTSILKSSWNDRWYEEEQADAMLCVQSYVTCFHYVFCSQG